MGQCLCSGLCGACCFRIPPGVTGAGCRVSGAPCTLQVRRSPSLASKCVTYNGPFNAPMPLDCLGMQPSLAKCARIVCVHPRTMATGRTSHRNATIKCTSQVSVLFIAIILGGVAVQRGWLREMGLVMHLQGCRPDICVAVLTWSSGGRPPGRRRQDGRHLRGHCLCGASCQVVRFSSSLKRGCGNALRLLNVASWQHRCTCDDTDISQAGGQKKLQTLR